MKGTNLFFFCQNFLHVLGIAKGIKLSKTLLEAFFLGGTGVLQAASKISEM